MASSSKNEKIIFYLILEIILKRVLPGHGSITCPGKPTNRGKIMRAISIETNIAVGFERISRYLSNIKILGMSMDMILLTAMIGICNFHILSGASSQNLIFQYDQFISGEVYRLITHPFVHLSWYHFLLDAGAFMLLYTGLEEKRKLRKLMIVGICGICGLAVPLLFAPAIYSQGLCGLSGIAHGLMAFSALELMQEKANFKTGAICLAAVSVKALYEAATGDVLFSFLQFGLCGIPIAICHAGGVMGGILSYFILHLLESINSARG
jgi:rhomboid family GlyGly-CTERM serine protease